MHCSATEWSRAKENDETFASEEQGETETMILLREREKEGVEPGEMGVMILLRESEWNRANGK